MPQKKFQDSNDNQKLDGPEMIAALKDYDLHQQIRGYIPTLERWGINFAASVEEGKLERLHKRLQDTKDPQKKAQLREEYATRLKEDAKTIGDYLEGIINEHAELKAIFPKGVSLAPEDVPQVIAQFRESPAKPAKQRG